MKFSEDEQQVGIDLWSDLVPEDQIGQDFDEEFEIDLEPHLFEIPSAPAPAGLSHLVSLGLCDSCLGRLGGLQSAGESLGEAGLKVRSEVENRDPELIVEGETEICPLCEGLFADIEIVGEEILSSLSDLEVERLQIGLQLPDDLVEDDEDARTRIGAPRSPALKASLTEAIGNIICENMKHTELVNDHPEVVSLVDLVTISVRLEIRPVYVYGRYLKHDRNLPQTRWPCRACRGRKGGCDACQGTGLQFPDSVQDLIGMPLVEVFNGEDNAFHGMGREDRDVRCLGKGRPFVCEIKSPKARTIDFASATKKINSSSEGKIEIYSLRASTKREVVRVKDTPAEKTYEIAFKMIHRAPFIDEKALEIPEGKRGRGRGRRKKKPHSNDKDAKVKVNEEGPLDEENLLDELDNESIRTSIESIGGVTLRQRTPERVAHRRADRVRERKIISATVERIEDALIVARFRTESGTYVKELIHGDGGRTRPSLAEKLGRVCEVEWLDVLDIHAD